MPRSVDGMEFSIDQVDLVLDTSALSGSEPWYGFRALHQHKILPAVALAELSTYWHLKGKASVDLGRLLDIGGIYVEKFTEEDALWAGRLMNDHNSRRRQAGVVIDSDPRNRDSVKGDCMIAAHGRRADRCIITVNKDDFRLLAHKVLTPEELQSAIE